MFRTPSIACFSYLGMVIERDVQVRFVQLDGETWKIGEIWKKPI
jgi:hypothetical protein